jgi:hypothetical protein
MSDALVPVDLSPFLEDPSSPAALAACAQLADTLVATSALVVRDPRVPALHNDQFIDLMEQYYEQPREATRLDERPEVHYQVRVQSGVAAAAPLLLRASSEGGGERERESGEGAERGSGEGAERERGQGGERLTRAETEGERLSARHALKRDALSFCPCLPCLLCACRAPSRLACCKRAPAPPSCSLLLPLVPSLSPPQTRWG